MFVKSGPDTRDVSLPFGFYDACRSPLILLRGRCAFQSSPPKFHRPKRCDGEQVADDMSGFHASESGGRKSRLEQIAHLPGGSSGGGARIKLFDRFKRGEALRGRVFHRIEIVISEQGE